MPTPTIIVAEGGCQWLAALRTCWRRRHLEITTPVWVHVPRVDAGRALSASPAAVAVLETSLATSANDVQQLDTWRMVFPAACLIAALDRRLDAEATRELAAAFLEAGAAYVLISLRRAADVLPLVDRHFHAVQVSGLEAPQAWTAGAAAGWQIPTIDLPEQWASVSSA